jgi:hypothetical protein
LAGAKEGRWAIRLHAATVRSGDGNPVAGRELEVDSFQRDRRSEAPTDRAQHHQGRLVLLMHQIGRNGGSASRRRGELPA